MLYRISAIQGQKLKKDEGNGSSGWSSNVRNGSLQSIRTYAQSISRRQTLSGNLGVKSRSQTDRFYGMRLVFVSILAIIRQRTEKNPYLKETREWWGKHFMFVSRIKLVVHNLLPASKPVLIFFCFQTIKALMSRHGSDTTNEEPKSKAIKLASTSAASWSTTVVPAHVIEENSPSTSSQPDAQSVELAEPLAAEEELVELAEFPSAGLSSVPIISQEPAAEGARDQLQPAVEKAHRETCSNCAVLKNENRKLSNRILTLQGRLAKQKGENRNHRRRNKSKCRIVKISCQKRCKMHNTWPGIRLTGL